MKRIDVKMLDYDKKMDDSIKGSNIEINKRFKVVQDGIQSSINNLEQYLEDVHNQQITDTEKLKKFVHALATMKETGAEPENLKQKAEKMQWVDQQLHIKEAKEMNVVFNE